MLMDVQVWEPLPYHTAFELAELNSLWDRPHCYRVCVCIKCIQFCKNSSHWISGQCTGLLRNFHRYAAWFRLQLYSISPHLSICNSFPSLSSHFCTLSPPIHIHTLTGAVGIPAATRRVPGFVHISIFSWAIRFAQNICLPVLPHILFTPLHSVPTTPQTPKLE